MKREIPPQLNAHKGTRPTTYFGFNPSVTKGDVRRCLEDFEVRDTHITALSRAYDLEPGTGWYVPPGVLHAPGSLLTYEPQWSTDLNCVFENVVCDEVYDRSFLEDICPDQVTDKISYIMDAVDWEANYDPAFKEHYFRPPVLLPETAKNLIEKWVCYGNDYISAKEVTIAPSSTVLLKDRAPYGCVLVQGFGTFGNFPAQTVTMMHPDQPTADEFFVSCQKAQKGVTIANHSTTEPMVILQHFGPDNAYYCSPSEQ